MNIIIYGPEQQATGGFDGGKITEQKPIGFPGEGSAVRRLGPLFYWSWAFADREGYIPSHPHQAFEIMTYVIKGKAEHGDSLGTKSVVGSGGAQVMQTGAGVYHEERFIGPDMEGFQIWFEPFIREALKREPTYHQYEDQDFPQEDKNGVHVKTVIGDQSPIDLVTDVQVWDVTIQENQTLNWGIKEGRTQAVLAIRGNGQVITKSSAESEESHSFQHKDFIVIESGENGTNQVQNTSQEDLRLLIIEVPTAVDYPLYPNTR